MQSTVEPGVKCTLREEELKIWSKAITSLASFGGTDIHFLFRESSLSLTTYDAAVTCHATIALNGSFFTSFELDEGIESLECKVPVKCVLKPFRSTRFMTKCVSECRIQFANGSDTLNVTMFTKFGAQVGYQLRLLFESDLLEVDLDTDTLTSKITCDAKFLLSTLTNFHHIKGTGDLTLKVSGSQVSLRNSATDLVKKEGKMYTELNLNDVDFLNYNIHTDCQLTFPLRDFKTFVTFAETLKLPVMIHFEDETQPVIVVISSDLRGCNAKLVLANRTNPITVAQPPPPVVVPRASTSNVPSSREASSVANERHRRQRGPQGSPSVLDPPDSPTFDFGENVPMDDEVQVENEGPIPQVPANQPQGHEVPEPPTSQRRLGPRRQSSNGASSGPVVNVGSPRKRPITTPLLFPNSTMKPSPTPAKIPIQSSYRVLPDSDSGED